MSFETDPVALSDAYARYREVTIQDRSFSQERHLELLHRICDPISFDLDTAGFSYENRAIPIISWGNGPTKVLLWSRMHGDEPTATMAIMDLFHFLQDDQLYPEFKRLLWDSLELKFITCLNPDGAVRFQRKNAQDIDINRDALDLKTPEARILAEVFDAFQPNWAVNLHDQSPYYTTDGGKNEVYFSFQVPPVDNLGTQTVSVELASSLLGSIIRDIQPLLGAEHLARYPVRYSPNAFGEFFQQRSVPTILIESGYRVEDTEKQWLRQQHWVLLIKLLERMATKQAILEEGVAAYYHQLPECSITNHDLVIESVSFPTKKGNKIADLGFRRIWRACQPEGALRTIGYLGSIGEPYSLKGKTYINGKYTQWESTLTYPDSLANMEELLQLDVKSLIQQGYQQFSLVKGPDTCWIDPGFPLSINGKTGNIPVAGQATSFFLKSKGGGASYLFHNGYIHELDSITSDYCRTFMNQPSDEKDQ